MHDVEHVDLHGALRHAHVDVVAMNRQAQDWPPGSAPARAPLRRVFRGGWIVRQIVYVALQPPIRGVGRNQEHAHNHQDQKHRSARDQPRDFIYFICRRRGHSPFTFLERFQFLPDIVVVTFPIGSVGVHANSGTLSVPWPYRQMYSVRGCPNSSMFGHDPALTGMRRRRRQVRQR